MKYKSVLCLAGEYTSSTVHITCEKMSGRADGLLGDDSRPSARVSDQPAH